MTHRRVGVRRFKYSFGTFSVMTTDTVIMKKLDRLQEDITFLKEQLSERLTVDELDAIEQAEDDLKKGKTRDL